MTKVKLAVVYGSTCGGCDVAFIDAGEKLAELTEIAEIVYWPYLMDNKKEDLRKAKDVDVGIFFGAIRTDKHKENAELLKEKSDIFVSFGTSACYGGIPGLANATTIRDLLKTSYTTALSTENPKNVVPSPESLGDENLVIPKLRSFLSPVSDFVDVDISVPGCPPPMKSVEKLMEILRDYQGGYTSLKKLTIAEERSLCEVCPREKPEEIFLEDFKRAHKTKINEDECFLKQGIVCLGPVTRAGCGATCIKANVPCRGCFGPVPNVRDQGTRILTAIATTFKAGKERDIGEEKLRELIGKISDPLGLFYLFSLASSIINRRYSDFGGEKGE